MEKKQPGREVTSQQLPGQPEGALCAPGTGADQPPSNLEHHKGAFQPATGLGQRCLQRPQGPKDGHPSQPCWLQRPPSFHGAGWEPAGRPLCGGWPRPAGHHLTLRSPQSPGLLMPPWDQGAKDWTARLSLGPVPREPRLRRPRQLSMGAWEWQTPGNQGRTVTGPGGMAGDSKAEPGQRGPTALCHPGFRAPCLVISPCLPLSHSVQQKWVSMGNTFNTLHPGSGLSFS